jgi:hypothetical protein
LQYPVQPRAPADRIRATVNATGLTNVKARKRAARLQDRRPNSSLKSRWELGKRPLSICVGHRPSTSK